MQRQQEKESHLGLVADLGGGGRGGPSQGLRRLWSSSGNRGTLQGSSSGSRGQSGRGAERHPLPVPGRQSHSPGPGGGHRPGGAAGGGQGRPVAGMGAVRLSPPGEDAPRPCASPHAQRLCIQLGLRALWGEGTATSTRQRDVAAHRLDQDRPGLPNQEAPGRTQTPTCPSPTQKYLEGVGFPETQDGAQVLFLDFQGTGSPRGQKTQATLVWNQFSKTQAAAAQTLGRAPLWHPAGPECSPPLTRGLRGPGPGFCRCP